jgi:hypothetical protein
MRVSNVLKQKLIVYLATLIRRMVFKNLILISLTIVLLSFIPNSTVNRINLTIEVKTLTNGKYVKVISEVLYEVNTAKMVTHFTYPKEYWTLTNKLGEFKLYIPSSNSVSLNEDMQFSTKGSLLYYLLAGNNSDMGLKEMNFMLNNTKHENGVMISEWLPPSNIAKFFKKVELVHRDQKAIFTGYYDLKGNLIKKVYYSKHIQVGGNHLPLKVVDIAYKTPTDSVVTHIILSDVKTDKDVNPTLVNFKIPDNAKFID